MEFRHTEYKRKEEGKGNKKVVNSFILNYLWADKGKRNKEWA